MSSETSIAAANFRLQEWAAHIRECQSCAAGMSVVSWCPWHGIKKRTIITVFVVKGKPALKPFREKRL